MTPRRPPNAPPAQTRADRLGAGVLVLLTLAYLWQLLFTRLILPRGDTFTYFYPYWQARAEALRSGRLPMWNPDLFMGAPFLANSQAGVLYPLNWPLAWFDAPLAIKLALALHVAIAAVGTYRLARTALRSSVLGGVTAAIVFAFGGYLGAQAEHINQVQGLGWLPWLLWAWHRSLGGQPRYAVIAGVFFALQLLAGHSQTAFISGVGLGVLALWYALAQARTARTAPGRVRAQAGVWRRISWPLAGVAVAAGVGALLAAVQILPTAQLTAFSNRSAGLPFREAVSFSFPPLAAARGLLPAYADQRLFSEYVAYSGVVGLALAVYGLWARRRERSVLGITVLATTGLFLSFGAYNPVYWALVRIVPGFDLFRAPARWLALTALGAALLAGAGLDALAARRPGRWGLVLPAGAVLGLAALTLFTPAQAGDLTAAPPVEPAELAIWLLTLAAALALMAWGTRRSTQSRTRAPVLLAVLAALELFMAARHLSYNSLSAPQAFTSQRPSISTLLAASADAAPARFLSLSDTRFSAGDERELAAVYGPALGDDGLYDLIVASKQKEILAPNLPMVWGIPSMDGFDGGVLPLRAYSELTGLFLPPGVNNPDGRLREYLDYAPDLPWLRMAGVRWIITDKVLDAWVDGVYYDLQFPTTLQAGEAVGATPPQPFPATGAGLVASLEGGDALPTGTMVGVLTVTPSGDGTAREVPLLAGEHVLLAAPESPAAGIADWGDPVEVARLTLTAADDLPGTLVVQGLSLVDSRTGAFLSTSLSADHGLRLIHSGDVKIYEDASARPRAYLACDVVLVADAETALAALAEDPLRVVIEDDPADSRRCDAPDGPVEIISYAPEAVTLQVGNPNPGAYLILSDAWYPGWTVTIDGRPAEIARANRLFRAVRMPDGNHEVTFTYSSRPLLMGAALSGVGLVVLLGALVLRHDEDGRQAGS